MSRYEVKFITNTQNYDLVMSWIQNSLLSFRKSYPNRVVNNIYFDDQNLTDFHDNAIGLSKRNKVRYRWYGDKNAMLCGYLEIKHKLNNLGSKEIHKISDLEFDLNSSWKNFTASLEEQLSQKAKNYLVSRKPVLFNSYHRQYFESFNKKIRITIDKEQKFYKQNSSLKPNFTRSNYPLDIITIEVKAEKEHQEIVSKLVKDIPLRQTKYSKFILGMI